MVENSSGITDEEPPLDFTHLGSEFSITEPGNKTGLSNSTDSLKSFENHEESESETTQTTENDSLRGSQALGHSLHGINNSESLKSVLGQFVSVFTIPCHEQGE